MAELHVSKKSIGKLFSEMQNKKFVIPDFQRPYKWQFEKCEDLWNDIVAFTESNDETDSDYFLGTIVSYLNEDKNQEIIDGQQRITSFFLLLRAFYRKLEDMDANDAVVKGLKNQIAPCIWDTDRYTEQVEDMSKIHIESLVATEEDNETFHKILETGQTESLATDNYSKNYRYFKEQCDEYAETRPMHWKDLCLAILRRCIILPIECDTPETALTIFSTLNDRGLPLSDSDIFKAQIYKNLEKDKRQEFTDTWKDLMQVCKEAKITVDDIFRYYSHKLRGDNYDKSKEVALRKFYSEDKYKKLKKDGLMADLLLLANFWRYINVGVSPDPIKISDEKEVEVTYVVDGEARKYIQILYSYPNDYWKYATSVFFLTNHELETFEQGFVEMLKKLTAFLLAKFIDKPTVNAIKDDIFGACISLANGQGLGLDTASQGIKIDDLRDRIAGFSFSRITRTLLFLEAYQNKGQAGYIVEPVEIEHIFPRKWQNTNYNGWSKDDADEYLDRFGNKMLLEKKLNIRAGNGYFGEKQNRYLKSKIGMAKELANYPKSDWVKEDIEEREAKFTDTVLTFLKIQLAG